ncbi:MAG: cupin domain-containing protein [Steroidobacteraceae bacterium]
MSTLAHRSPLILKLGTAIAALLLCAPLARAQAPTDSGSHVVTSASRRGAGPLMRRDLIGVPGKEVLMSVIEVPPGASSPPHRHYAQVFVYILQGTMIMQVKGGPRVTLGPGQTFYESPTDIHTVSANASKTEPAKFLAILIKDKNKPATVMMTPRKPHQAH